MQAVQISNISKHVPINRILFTETGKLLINGTCVDPALIKLTFDAPDRSPEEKALAHFLFCELRKYSPQEKELLRDSSHPSLEHALLYKLISHASEERKELQFESTGLADVRSLTPIGDQEISRVSAVNNYLTNVGEVYREILTRLSSQISPWLRLPNFLFVSLLQLMKRR
ncbi:MAG: hypothetical protein R3A13_03885 [Bdellovibrionota bacterium]